MVKLVAPTGPARRIFHITHIENLPGIVAKDLVCDAARIKHGLPSTNIGYSHIKQRRLSIRVPTTGGGCLGDYVPFNFGPRSVMLYVVGQGHPGYAGGQAEIVHLVSTISTATRLGQPWAFTDRHAEVHYAQYYEDLADLGQVPWKSVNAHYWAHCKEEKQAEFLVQNAFPWTAVEHIGVFSDPIAARVHAMLTASTHQPSVLVRPAWYY